MTTAPIPVAELTTNVIRVLCREFGAANTARFLNQFTTGFGDYTADRERTTDDATVDQLVKEIRWMRRKTAPSRRTRRVTLPT